MKRECETCIKRKTIYCPTSMECMVTDDMPYYQDRIMLLEENKQLKDNWNKLKEIAKSQSSFKKHKDLFDKFYFEIDELLETMQELEQGGNNDE